MNWGRHAISGSTELSGNPRIFNGSIWVPMKYTDSDGGGLRNEDKIGLYRSDPFLFDFY